MPWSAPRNLARLPAAGAPCDMLVCPPATLLASLRSLANESVIMLGGQDCHAEASGAFTGDLSAPMLADLGCTHVIVGHSERRRGHGEDNVQVRAKAEAAHGAGLTAIVCLGEDGAERAAGRESEVASVQLADSLPATAGSHNTVIAYEPVWAIGTGRTATPGEVGAMHAVLRRELVRLLGDDGHGVRVLYGGSVTGDNAAELLRVKQVDGALVGGASLRPREFWRIACSAPG